MNNKVKQDIDKESRELAFKYMEILVDVARESFLILDSDLTVISANSVFYKNFNVSKELTANVRLYDLGNGQWNIPELKKMLEEILQHNEVIRDYEVTHVFETIGQKTILLNARRIDTIQLIVLAMEDITDRKNLEDQLAEYTQELEVKVAKRTAELADRISELEKLNKTMVNRELRMVELKKENESLRK